MQAIKRKRMHPLKRAVIIMFAVVFALAAVFAFFMICDVVAHNTARTVPNYPRQDLSAVLAKEEWSDEDYDLIYRQTGLTRAYFEGLDARPDEEFILRCQNDLFFEGEYEHDADTFGTAHDYFPDEYFAMVELEPGDVLISASVHTMGWKNGHAALVVGGSSVLQAFGVGTVSDIVSPSWFRRAANFMVLRPKLEKSETDRVVSWALKNMNGVEYSLFTGIFSPKDQTDDPRDTQCAHLVWQAYYACGYDIDSTGGPVVSPKNIANSDLFEVIQVNGFDLDTLWR